MVRNTLENNHMMKKKLAMCLLALLPLSMMAGNGSDTLTVRIDDMHCRKCSNRIISQVGTIEGVDTMIPRLARHSMFIRFDANRISGDSLRAAISQIGYTPVCYYGQQATDFAYFNIPAEAATQETLDKVKALQTVSDANVNKRRGALAVAFYCQQTTAEQLLADIQKLGIEAVVPAPHECKKEGEKK
jgi:copper chaperone CopZ